MVLFTDSSAHRTFIFNSRFLFTHFHFFLDIREQFETLEDLNSLLLNVTQQGAAISKRRGLVYDHLKKTLVGLVKTEGREALDGYLFSNRAASDFVMEALGIDAASFPQDLQDNRDKATKEARKKGRVSAVAGGSSTAPPDGEDMDVDQEEDAAATVAASSPPAGDEGV